jgi:hypothetical protein
LQGPQEHGAELSASWSAAQTGAEGKRRGQKQAAIVAESSDRSRYGPGPKVSASVRDITRAAAGKYQKAEVGTRSEMTQRAGREWPEARKV